MDDVQVTMVFVGPTDDMAWNSLQLAAPEQWTLGRSRYSGHVTISMPVRESSPLTSLEYAVAASKTVLSKVGNLSIWNLVSLTSRYDGIESFSGITPGGLMATKDIARYARISTQNVHSIILKRADLPPRLTNDLGEPINMWLASVMQPYLDKWRITYRPKKRTSTG